MMSPAPNRPRRRPEGSPEGGRFAPEDHAEADVSVDPDAIDDIFDDDDPEVVAATDASVGLGVTLGDEVLDEVPERPISELGPELAQVAQAGSWEELEPYAGHPDPDVRAEVATSLHMAPHQAARLARDPDFVVRWQVLTSQTYGVGDVLAEDPDPVIRFGSLRAVDLSDEARHRLVHDDPEVRRVWAAMAAATAPPQR